MPSLEKGVGAWNAWRLQRHDIAIDLNGADFATRPNRRLLLFRRLVSRRFAPTIERPPSDVWNTYAVRKQYAFRTFIDAMTFVNRIAPEAEAADHHPDILTNDKRVTLTYSTDSHGGLTVKDFEGAAKADRLEPPRAAP